MLIVYCLPRRRGRTHRPRRAGACACRRSRRSRAVCRQGALLEVDNVRKAFGGLVAVDDYRFAIDARRDHRPDRPQRIGQDHGVESDLRRAVGAMPATIRFKGRRSSPARAHRIARLGVARTFQLVRMLESMTVHRQCHCRASPSGADSARWRDRRERAAALLARVGLGGTAALPAANSPISTRNGSNWRARWRSSRDLLLLDEWLAGLNPTELGRASTLVRSLRGDGAHHHPGRARDGRDPLALRPLHRDECRPQDRRGPPAARARRRGGGPRLSRRRTMLEAPRYRRRLRQASRRSSASTSMSRRGEIVVILGANGAGKSDAAQGDRRAGHAAARRLGHARRPRPVGLPPHEIVEAGVALVPEGRGIFGELTVRENLMLGAYPRRARHCENANLAPRAGAFPAARRALAAAGRAP